MTVGNAIPKSVIIRGTLKRCSGWGRKVFRTRA